MFLSQIKCVPFFLSYFSPCSSRVRIPIRLHFASGRFLTAAPSATSGRTIPICINTWPNTIRLALWMRWSASRLGTVNLSIQPMWSWALLYLKGLFCLQTASIHKIMWKQTKKYIASHRNSAPWGPTLSHDKMLLKLCSVFLSAPVKSRRCLQVLIIESVAAGKRELPKQGESHLFILPPKHALMEGWLQCFYLFISFVCFDLWGIFLKYNCTFLLWSSF